MRGKDLSFCSLVCFLVTVQPRLKRAPVSGVLHTSPSAVLINSHG